MQATVETSQKMLMLPGAVDAAYHDISQVVDLATQSHPDKNRWTLVSSILSAAAGVLQWWTSRQEYILYVAELQQRRFGYCRLLIRSRSSALHPMDSRRRPIEQHRGWASWMESTEVHDTRNRRLR
jgi:hypothetical protein